MRVRPSRYAGSTEKAELAWGMLGVPATAGLAELISVVEAPSATLRHAYYREGAIVSHHRHSGPSLVYGVGGPCHDSDNQTQIVKRRLTYHPAGHEHSLRYDGPTHVLCFEISDEYLESHDGCWPAVSTPLPATLYDAIWATLLLVASDSPSDGIERAITGLLEGASRFVRQDAPRRILDVIDFVHAHWRTIPSACAIADHFGISPQHLTRTFKRWTGVTLQQYALALRVDYARGLLWGTGLSISDVAAETGFCDQSHLTRVLGWHSRHTPSRLRAIMPADGRGLLLPSR